MATYGALDIKFLTKVYGNKEVGSAIAKLRLKLTDTKPLLQQIGLIHLLNTRRRFESQTDPKGRVWKYNTKTTQKYKASGLRGGDNPGLFGDKGRTPAVMGPNHRGVWTGRLMESLDTRMSGNTVIVYVKKDIPYARVFQEGAYKGEFHIDSSSKGAPIHYPWGPIPARPFLGTNKKTDEEVLKLLRSYLDITKDQPSWPVGVPRS